MDTNYTTQDRGDKKSYQQYLDAMDAISIEKVASASVFFEPKRGNTIVDEVWHQVRAQLFLHSSSLKCK